MKTQTPYEKLAALRQEMRDLIQREDDDQMLPDDGSRAEILEDRIREAKAAIRSIEIREMMRQEALQAKAENQDYDEASSTNKTA